MERANQRVVEENDDELPSRLTRAGRANYLECGRRFCIEDCEFHVCQL